MSWSLKCHIQIVSLARHIHVMSLVMSLACHIRYEPAYMSHTCYEDQDVGERPDRDPLRRLRATNMLSAFPSHIQVVRLQPYLSIYRSWAINTRSGREVQAEDTSPFWDQNRTTYKVSKAFP